MTTDELAKRVHERGGELRLHGRVVQFRPAAVLNAAERRWLVTHHAEVVAILVPPQPEDTDAFRRWLRLRFGLACVAVGDAGNGQSAWLPGPLQG